MTPIVGSDPSRTRRSRCSKDNHASLPLEEKAYGARTKNARVGGAITITSSPRRSTPRQPETLGHRERGNSLAQHGARELALDGLRVMADRLGLITGDKMHVDDGRRDVS